MRSTDHFTRGPRPQLRHSAEGWHPGAEYRQTLLTRQSLEPAPWSVWSDVAMGDLCNVEPDSGSAAITGTGAG